MEIVNYIEYILLGLCGLSIIALFIFILRTQKQDLDYDKIIRELNGQKTINLQKLKDGNKEIDKIENRILECKKKLGLKLFKKRK